MYIRNRKLFIFRNCWLLITVVLLFLIQAFPFFLIATSPPKPEIHTFTSSKGLRLKIIKSSQIPFIHAQLVIYYREKVRNPAIPYLTFMNIFGRNIPESDTSVLNTLEKLGNDFKVEHRPDFLLFKINFLPEKQQTFIRFLKALYNYKPFIEFNSPSPSFNDKKNQLSTQARFKNIVDNYWYYFFKKKNWKDEIAYQIAYHHFFPNTKMGQVLITPKDLKSVQLEQLISFYKATYQLPNSLLILKGNIDNPAIFYGHVEHTLPSSKKIPPLKQKIEKLTIDSPKKILIFNVENDGSPIMYWFEAVLFSNKENPVSSLILNNILFAFPLGRIFINARYFNINNLRMDTEMVNHRQVSLICNSMRINYSEMGKFILLADRERKKIKIKEVERREFLNTLSNIYQRLKVNTQNFENEVNIQIMDTEYFTKKVTLASLNKMADNSNHVVIVIVGSARLLLPQLEPFKSIVGVIDFNL